MVRVCFLYFIALNTSHLGSDTSAKCVTKNSKKVCGFRHCQSPTEKQSLATTDNPQQTSPLAAKLPKSPWMPRTKNPQGVVTSGVDCIEVGWVDCIKTSLSGCVNCRLAQIWLGWLSHDVHLYPLLSIPPWLLCSSSNSYLELLPTFRCLQPLCRCAHHVFHHLMLLSHYAWSVNLDELPIINCSILYWLLSCFSSYASQWPDPHIVV